MPDWGNAFSVRMPSDRVWFRRWLKEHKGRDGHMCRSHDGQTKGSDPDAWFVGSARAKIGIGLASARFTAATKKVMDGRVVSKRKGGARLYVISGMFP